jgi:outer membrane protein assembly factor BamB
VPLEGPNNDVLVAAEDGDRIGNDGGVNRSALFRLSGDGNILSQFQSGDDIIVGMANAGEFTALTLYNTESSQASVKLLDQNEEEIWTYLLQRGSIGSVKINNDGSAFILVTTTINNVETGTLYLLDPQGDLRWKVEKEGASIPRYHVSGNEIFVTLQDAAGVDVLRLATE